MFDYTLFERVTRLVNGERKGKRHTEFPEYIDDMKQIVRQFNQFTNEIIEEYNRQQPADKQLRIVGQHNNWQNSGYYNPYFWNKVILKNGTDFGIAIWFLINHEGLRLSIGTTGDIENTETTDVIKRINNFFIEKSSRIPIEHFAAKLDDKYASFLYEESDISKDAFVEALKAIVPLYIDVVSKYKNGYFNADLPETETATDNIKTIKNHKIKNIILYGVPGVGKTHNITKLIRLIEEEKSDSEIFSEIQNNVISDVQLPDKLKERTAFVTFHQSFGYEDFIEGFRPNEEGKIELVDGVFKRLASQARENLMQSQTTNVVPFREALHRLLKDKIENEETVKIDLKRADSYYLIYDYNDRTIFFEKQNGDRSHSLSIRTLERMYNEEQNSIIQGGLAPYYNPLLEKLLEIKRSGTQAHVEQKKYYLVIDEINRGNISKIFGELITLIEEDKRDRLEVTLPYSKEPFSVPSNLYIIGTMNSTDKSIALIDVALRRRFTFLKMEPKPELIEHQKAKEVFETLNEFLKERLDEDHQIGHSYFMKIQDDEDLKFVLDYKIKPLLEEYFYGDSEGFNETMKLLEVP